MISSSAKDILRIINGRRQAAICFFEHFFVFFSFFGILYAPMGVAEVVT
jgi:hypothetical protein